MKPMRVGLVGCGRISDIYLKNCATFDAIDIVACASLDLEESRVKAARHGIARACSPGEIYADDTIDCVLNLTIPSAHAEVSKSAVLSGKHVYSEKPFVTDVAEGRDILDLAAERRLTVGNAPDTFLGGRWQTVRKVVDSGLIGRPTGVSAFVPSHGTERHNPNPEFYYQAGGGPLLDLGPYYLTVMVACLGPIARVAGLSRRTFDERMIENGPRNGAMMPVEVDTHCLSLIEFENDVIGQMMMSFDIWDSETPRFEIYGEDGTICIADPDPVDGANLFQGEVWVRTRETSRWTHKPRPTGREAWLVAENTHGFNYDARGLGLLEMAIAVQDGCNPRAGGEMALHVVETMQGMLTSPGLGRFVEIASTCERPLPLPEDFPQTRG